MVVLRLLAQKLLQNGQVLRLKIFGRQSKNLFERLRKAGMVFIAYLVIYFAGFFLVMQKQVLGNLHSPEQ
jgi:Trk-type K+ transport system membrane component